MRTFNPSSKKLQGMRGLSWARGQAGATLFNHFQTPNDTQYKGNGCRNAASQAWLDNGFSAPAASWHSGGVNTLMGDGSVKVIKYDDAGHLVHMEKSAEVNEAILAFTSAD